ncbi:DUF106 domain-containing protein [Candidatus Methanomassiliicoccus intestinalis]|uniref:DUF106 domain-containing protein n=1 Tax=Candidatus Methanomassiliicoccus intestinalis TaxID=1406512 RepID=UPI0037DDD583
MIITLLIFVFAMVILFDPTIRNGLGEIVGYALDPTLGALGQNDPVPALFLTGMLMIALSTIIRHFTTDYVKQAETQKITSAFNKELRAAYQENNKYKIKKMTEMQQEMMQKSMDMSTGQMKIMPITMIIIIPFFAWIGFFCTGLSDTAQLISVPWAEMVNLNGKIGPFFNWMLLYSAISIPFGQLLSRLLRFIMFRKRLREIEAAEAEAATQ